MSASSADDGRQPPHVALLPSAGMGHLTPFCRLAVALSSRGCVVSVVAVQPTVSSAESRHLSSLFSSHPDIKPLHLHLPLSSSTVDDPFFLRFESIRRSAHLLPPLLSAASVTTFIVDITLASAFLPSHTFPTYILFTSSAEMLALCAAFPAATSVSAAGVDIPGLRTIPLSSIPPPLRDPHHLFTSQFVANGRALADAAGILINTYQDLEPLALNGGRLAAGLPEVTTVGPLPPLRTTPGRPTTLAAWLDEQPARSVVYVSFGSRTSMSLPQIRELGAGLEKSGCRFVWVVKSRIVDRDDDAALDEMLDGGFMERVKGRGLVVKGWVEQVEVLGHAAVGGFVSHCGWNSVTEAAIYGVRVLVWPRGGDQRVTAETVRRSGLGFWVEDWSWEAEERVVGGEEIGQEVRKMMEDEGLRVSAARVAEEAARAVAEGGSSDRGLREFISKLKV